jgi:hypothetical protein
MNIRFDRIEQAQVLMRQHGLLGIMVMNHDDYRYFFGTDRTQPRAIIPRALDKTLGASYIVNTRSQS